MARLFDAYIMVDWSAASKPVQGANSIWVGILARDARLKMTFSAANPGTRLSAVRFLIDIIGKLNRRGDRVLLGFDFSLGYPAGTAEALGLLTSEVSAWKAMGDYLSAKVKERDDNKNHRFAIAASMNYAISGGPFPFWGAPTRDQATTLSGTKGDFGKGHLPEYRTVESHLRASGKGQPKSCWQLAYSGSVGSQSILGIPHVHRLAKELPQAKVWPFELGLSAVEEEHLVGIQTVIAEIYPSLVKANPKKGEVLDQAQTEAIARHYWSLDEKKQLSSCFGPPDSLRVEKIPQIEGEEGWILGI